MLKYCIINIDGQHLLFMEFHSALNTIQMEIFTSLITNRHFYLKLEITSKQMFTEIKSVLLKKFNTLSPSM